MNFRKSNFCKQTILIIFGAMFPLYLCAQGFTDVSAAAGLGFQHDGVSVVDTKLGSGAAWIDYDKDGFLDLYVSMRTGSNKLFHNNGLGYFIDVAISMNADDSTGDGAGVSIADIDNDGWDDIFLCNHGGNKLLKNNMGTSFTDITTSAFVDSTVSGVKRSTSATWGDYDGDSYLDLYITQHNPAAGNDSVSQDYLYYNNGDETFTDVSQILDTLNMLGWAFIGGWTDFDKDNDLDIIVINDCSLPPSFYYPTQVFQNNGGSNPLTWNFSQNNVGVGINDCRNGMGIAVGDYNRDGWMDVFYTNVGDCVLFENNQGAFSDVSAATGIDAQPSSYFSWGPSFMDYDLDGWQDIMVAFGTLHDSATDPQPNMLFRNLGNGTFTDVAPALGIDDDRRSRNAIYGDYDNDGDLDIFVVNYGDDVTLLRNDNNNGYHWLKVKLEGSQTNTNRNGVGTKIKISTPDGLFQYYETRSGSNLGGGDSPYAHFGLNSNTLVSEIELTWLSGEIQTFTNLEVDSMYTFVEDWCTDNPTRTWTGAIDNDWAKAANWDVCGVPKLTNPVIIPSGSPDCIISSGLTGTCMEIDVKTGATFFVETGGVLNVSK